LEAEQLSYRSVLKVKGTFVKTQKRRPSNLPNKKEYVVSQANADVEERREKRDDSLALRPVSMYSFMAQLPKL